MLTERLSYVSCRYILDYFTIINSNPPKLLLSAKQKAPLHPEQVSVSASIDEIEDFESFLYAVYEQPVRLDVALAAAFVTPHKLMVMELSSKFSSFGQHLHNVVQFVHRQPALLRQLVRPLESGGVFNAVFHASILFR